MNNNLVKETKRRTKKLLQQQQQQQQQQGGKTRKNKNVEDVVIKEIQKKSVISFTKYLSYNIVFLCTIFIDNIYTRKESTIKLQIL